MQHFPSLFFSNDCENDGVYSGESILIFLLSIGVHIVLVGCKKNKSKKSRVKREGVTKPFNEKPKETSKAYTLKVR